MLPRFEDLDTSAPDPSLVAKAHECCPPQWPMDARRSARQTLEGLRARGGMVQLGWASLKSLWSVSRSALPRVGETSGFAKDTVSLSGTTLAGLLLLTPFLSIYPAPVQ